MSDVTTVRTTNGIQTRQRAHRMRRTAIDAEDSDGDGGAKRGRVTVHYIVHHSSPAWRRTTAGATLAEKT